MQFATNIICRTAFQISIRYHTQAPFLVRGQDMWRMGDGDALQHRTTPMLNNWTGCKVTYTWNVVLPLGFRIDGEAEESIKTYKSRKRFTLCSRYCTLLIRLTTEATVRTRETNAEIQMYNKASNKGVHYLITVCCDEQEDPHSAVKTLTRIWKRWKRRGDNGAVGLGVLYLVNSLSHTVWEHMKSLL